MKKLVPFIFHICRDRLPTDANMNPEDVLAGLTGVRVLPAGIGALRCGSAVCRGGGGRRKLAAGVGSFARLVSTQPSGAGGSSVGLLGGRGQVLWRPLLVQLHSFANCRKSTDSRLSFQHVNLGCSSGHPARLRTVTKP